MMKDLKRVDLWVGVGLMALSIAVWLMTASLPVPERGIGPGKYPRVISVMMFGSGRYTNRNESARRTSRAKQ